MRAIILAGGFGTRLHPVTLETPKPLLTVKKKPILNHLIDLFISNGVGDIVVLVNKNHRDDYNWWKKRYADQLPKKLCVEVEPRPLGTFGHLKNLQHYFREPFILSNGDELKDLDLKKLIAFHNNHAQKPLATIALVKVDDPSRYGVPILKKDTITDFLEKPKNSPSNYISSGLYILEPEIFSYADAKKDFLMIEKDIFPKLAADGKLVGYKADNYRWFPCDTLEKWESAIKNW